LKNVRQKKILEILELKKIVSVSELSKSLNASLMTIRRDLDYFEKQGVISKTHGGAIFIEKEKVQPSFEERIIEFDEEKDKIGKAAVRLIKNGDIVFFDAGTTPLSIVKYINNDLEISAISIGLITSIALCDKPKINVISIGGNIHHSSYSSINYISVDLIKKFNADIAFISTKAISLPQGTFEVELPLIEVKRAIVSVSKKVVLVADHTKFESKSLSLSIPMDDIHTIITDDKTSPKIIQEIKKMGKEVIIT
jgi:DeoR/GlpR family transcriptional regulator of sugar metabolism